MVYRFIFLLIFSFALLAANDVQYDVSFDGIQDQEILNALNSVSELVILRDSPPNTLTALRRRADADLRNLTRALQSFGLYDAKLRFSIDAEHTPAIVHVIIDVGPVYPLAEFKIVPDSDEECDEVSSILPEDVGIEIGMPALPKTIIDAENAILCELTKRGYPAAEITKRDVVADQATHTISVTLFVDSGPLIYFGETIVTGLEDVQECFVRKKIAWCEEDCYDPKLIVRTICNIESSGLFSAVTISGDDDNLDDDLLPMKIELIEARHRTIGGGVSYNTQVGPGVIALWEHRNVRGLGEKASIKADIAEQRQTGTILYKQPDYICAGQDLLWITEYENERTRGFADTAFSFSGIVDRELDLNSRFSYGGTIKQLHTENSNNNNQFILFKIPLLYRWSTANSLLDPTRGHTLTVRVTPTTGVVRPVSSYVINTLTATYYYSLNTDKTVVLAAKAMLGSIWGSSDIRIPPPERFFIGSENTLRGYNYLTVSPLGPENKPLGGRSMVVLVLETRFRISECFGSVLFYEIGNVALDSWPHFGAGERQSVGTGLRYHTPVGPLRFDVAFPLNRRKGIDRAFQFYFSIGQAF